MIKCAAIKIHYASTTPCIWVRSGFDNVEILEKVQRNLAFWSTTYIHLFYGFLNEKDEFLGPKHAMEEAVRSGQFTEEKAKKFFNPTFIGKTASINEGKYGYYNDCSPIKQDGKRFVKACTERTLHPKMLWESKEDYPECEGDPNWEAPETYK